MTQEEKEKLELHFKRPVLEGMGHLPYEKAWRVMNFYKGFDLEQERLNLEKERLKLAGAFKQWERDNAGPPRAPSFVEA